MVQKIPISIIIVNYNSGDYLRQCLRSITAGGFAGEIIVVDNHSTDDSLAEVRQIYPPLKLVESGENLGFARANNIGSRQATSDYLLFLNPDTQVINSCINTLYHKISENANLGALGCKILNPDGSIQFSCGHFPTLLNVVADRISIIKNILPTELIRQPRFYEGEQNPDWVSGVCLLVPRAAFEKIGGLDEDYFMYVEEVDLCYRLKKAGYTVVYTPEAKIIHYYQGGSGERKSQKAQYMRKGLLRFFKKYRNRFEYSSLKVLTKYF